MSCQTTDTAAGRSTLILVRHAHTEMAGRFCGQIDPPLSQQGIVQLADLGERLKDFSFTQVFSSDLQRARQTAESIARPRQLPVETKGALREIAFGGWEGLNWDEVMMQDAAFAQRWLDHYPSVPAPGGEDFADFRQRIHDALSEIATQVGEGTVVVVTHAGVIRTFLAELARQQHVAADFANCDYTSCWPVWREHWQWVLPEIQVAELVAHASHHDE